LDLSDSDVEECPLVENVAVGESEPVETDEDLQEEMWSNLTTYKEAALDSSAVAEAVVDKAVAEAEEKVVAKDTMAKETVAEDKAGAGKEDIEGEGEAKTVETGVAAEDEDMAPEENEAEGKEPVVEMSSEELDELHDGRISRKRRRARYMAFAKSVEGKLRRAGNGLTEEGLVVLVDEAQREARGDSDPLSQLRMAQDDLRRICSMGFEGLPLGRLLQGKVLAKTLEAASKDLVRRKRSLDEASLMGQVDSLEKAMLRAKKKMAKLLDAPGMSFSWLDSPHNASHMREQDFEEFCDFFAGVVMEFNEAVALRGHGKMIFRKVLEDADTNLSMIAVLKANFRREEHAVYNGLLKEEWWRRVRAAAPSVISATGVATRPSVAVAAPLNLVAAPLSPSSPSAVPSEALVASSGARSESCGLQGSSLCKRM
jgi:hypothetical protein